VKVKTGYEDKRLSIELIALIDVVFLLLVFFIYAMLSMAVEDSLGLNLPETHGDSSQPGIVITLNKDNQLYLEGEAMPLDRLVSAVSRRYKQSGLPVIIRGDRTADLGAAVELLGALRRRGVKRASFRVQERGQQK